MATNPQQPKGFTVKLPDSLTLKDLISIITVAVTLTTAWGVFSTRITVVEKEVELLKNSDKAIQAQTDRLRRQVRRLEAHQQDDELLLDQVFILLRRPLPQRRADGKLTE